MLQNSKNSSWNVVESKEPENRQLVRSQPTEMEKKQPIPMWNLRQNIDHLCAIGESIKLKFLSKWNDMKQDSLVKDSRSSIDLLCQYS